MVFSGFVMKDLIKNIILDFHKRGIPEFITRDFDIPVDSGKIVTLIGSRRTGKTYALFQVMSKIDDITKIVYINFEDERLNFTHKNLQEIIEAYFELYPTRKENEIYFFFDEIQEINGWEKFLRRINDTITTNIFVTGSSAKLLSKEIATSLRGRTITFKIFPLSFGEFLTFKNIDKEFISTHGKATVIAALNEYMSTSSFPETVNMQPHIRENTLRMYFDVMLFRDVIERNDIKNIYPIKYLLHKLMGNPGKQFSVHKIYNELKSQGIKISKNSLYDYLNFISDAFIIFPVQNFSEKINNKNQKKSYSIDHGLASSVSATLSRDYGRMLENIVFIHLVRKYDKIFFFKEKRECDFIIKEKNKITECLQVCSELNEDNKEREINGLKEAMNYFSLKKGKIVTLNQTDKIDNIEVQPVYRWLLENF